MTIDHRPIQCGQIPSVNRGTRIHGGLFHILVPRPSAQTDAASLEVLCSTDLVSVLFPEPSTAVSYWELIAGRPLYHLINAATD